MLKFVIAIMCLLLSSINSAPTPQDIPVEEIIFDEETLSQQGNLSPKGFTQPVQNQEKQQQKQNSVRSPGVEILRYIYDFNDIGYKFTYELSDGTIRSEQGAYKDGVDEEGNPSKVLIVQGAYSFVGSDGETYWTNYQSDEKGYRPESGKGVGGIKPNDDAEIDPNLLKSLVG